jgi:hypothetical protein
MMVIGAVIIVAAPVVGPLIGELIRPVVKTLIKGGMVAYQETEKKIVQVIESFEFLAKEAKAELM